MILAQPVSGIQMSGASELGTITGTSFTAGTVAGKGLLTASLNGLSTTIRVIVE